MEENRTLVLTKLQAELLCLLTEGAQSVGPSDLGLDETEENEAAFEELLAKLRQL